MHPFRDLDQLWAKYKKVLKGSLGIIQGNAYKLWLQIL